MSQPVFTNFKAFPDQGGNAIKTFWTYDASFAANVSGGSIVPQNLCILITDASNVSSTSTISSLVVIPILDASNNLTNRFTITNSTSNLDFLIENGTSYQLMAQMVYDMGDLTYSRNSEQNIVMCSTIPPVPMFDVTSGTNCFNIKLKNSNGTQPTRISSFDGFQRLKGVFITYSSPTQLYSTFVANDASDNVYHNTIKIDASLNDYEVAVNLYNSCTDVSFNTRSGGRSSNSRSQQVTVSNVPGTVEQLSAYETMRDSSSNMQTAATYTRVSNTIKWSTPITGNINSPITSYKIYRDNSLIETKTTGLTDVSFSFIDPLTTLDVSNNYTYMVKACNASGDGTGVSCTVKGVVFPTQTSLSVDPSGSQILRVSISNVPNGFPINSYKYDISYNGPAIVDTSSNPYIISSLTNGTPYTFKTRTKVTSLTDASVNYITDWSPSFSATPYNPVLANATDISVNPLDTFGVPSGNILVSWTNPDKQSYDGQLWYDLYRKPTADASFSSVPISTGNSIQQQIQSFNDTTLTNGTSYTYKVVNRQVGLLQELSTSTGLISRPIIPFVLPGAVTGLQASPPPCVTDISYNFVAPSSNGGYPLNKYVSSWYNLSDGSTNFMSTIDISNNVTSVNRAALTQGNKYRVFVNAVVNGNTDVSGQNMSFNGPSAELIFFTKPAGLDLSGCNAVQNVANGQINNGLFLDWSANPQYTAMDASNASFKIYKSGSYLGTTTQSSYLDTTAVVGVQSSYQVLACVNNVDSEFYPNITPTPSNPVARLALPNNVTNLTVDNRTNTSAHLRWTAASGNTGTDASNVIYRYTATDTSTNIVDVSGNTADISFNITSLHASGVYDFKLYSGLVMNGANYFNTTYETTTESLYDPVLQSRISSVHSSSGAILVDIVPAMDVSGLTFNYYSLEVATDASFTNIIKSPTSSVSEFYVNNLTDGSTYYVRSANIYKDVSNESVTSVKSLTHAVTPMISPNQPTGLVVDTTTNPNTVRLSWDVPTSGSIPTMYCITSSPFAANTVDMSVNSFTPVSDFSVNTVNSVNKYFRIFTGLTSGARYYFTIVGGFRYHDGTVAVSQPSLVAEAIPYTVPSRVSTLTADPGPTNISLAWLAPNTTNGAGEGTNGPIRYAIKLATDASFNNIVQDISGVSTTQYNFTGLLADTMYYSQVSAYFMIQGTTIRAQSIPVSISALTQPVPIAPTLSATANVLDASGNQLGKAASLSWTLDPNYSSCTTISRKVRSPDGTQLLHDYITVTDISSNLQTVRTYTDTHATVNDSSGNFLNGNQIFYKIDVSYNVPYSSPKLYTVEHPTPVIPFSRPIMTRLDGSVLNATDISYVLVPTSPDASGAYSSFNLYINKNGSSITNLVAIGITQSGLNVIVKIPSVTDIAYNNVQVFGAIAKDQYGTIRINYTDPNNNPVKVINTMIVENNAGGALILKSPVNSFA